MSEVTVIPSSEDTTEEASLRAALEKADNESLQEQAPDRTPEPEKSEDKTQESVPSPDEEKQVDKSDSSESEAEKETSSPERDEKGRFKSKSEQTQAEETPQEPQGDQKPQKEDKEAQRLAKSWQKVEQEKLEVRNALAEVRQLKQQLAQMAQRTQPQQQPRFSSREYMAASEEFERQAASLMEEGDVDGAKQKLDLARQSRMAAQQFGTQEMTEAQQRQAQSFEMEWQRHAEDEIKKHPELGDPSTVEAQAMMELLEQYPILGHMVDGFRKGVELLSMRRDAASASELRTENEKLKKEIKELREKTAISGGGLTSKVSPQDFDKMTLDQQEAYLERVARSEDFSRSN